jgi:hypothetical protein
MWHIRKDAWDIILTSGAHLVRFVQRVHNKNYVIDEKEGREKKGREAEELIARLLY